MYQVTAIIRPHRLEDVKAAVADVGVTGISVSDVRGCGNSPEPPMFLAGQEIKIALPLKSKLVTVITDEQLEPVIDAILRHAHTGEPGDGKIFVERVSDAIRIRTMERGNSAV